LWDKRLSWRVHTWRSEVGVSSAERDWPAWPVKIRRSMLRLRPLCRQQLAQTWIADLVDQIVKG